jgi:hypothetical protein
MRGIHGSCRSYGFRVRFAHRGAALVEPDGREFAVLRSPDTAEHDPDYLEVGRFPTREKAEEFLASVEASFIPGTCVRSVLADLSCD